MGAGEGGDTIQYSGGTYAMTNPRNGSREIKPVLEKKKSVGYDASTSNQLLAISQSASSTTTGESIPKSVEVVNSGRVPVVVMTGYREWTSATAWRILHSSNEGCYKNWGNRWN